MCPGDLLQCQCAAGFYWNIDSCTSCSFGLTTLQTGAISSAACTCTAGYVSTTPGDPASCEACGNGFFCHGGDHREACPPSTSTVGQDAGSMADCVCDAGHVGNLGSVLCEECPAGRFKDSIGTDECQPCPIGTWSNISGAISSAACKPCVAGSTTKSNASSTEDLCMRPHGGQSFNCTSGALCEVHLDGFHLQDRHRLLLADADCERNKVGVSGVGNEGISEAASNNGSRYMWNNFVPDGGDYYLCWCANTNGLACADFADFQISAGQLRVIGPSGNHKFRCVRGKDCTDLHVQGVGLSQGHRVAVRSGCGTESILQLSPANQNGRGIFNITSSHDTSNLTLSFGASNLQQGIDYRVSVNANEAGHDLCWCGRGSCNAEDFVVPFGKLSVLGPFAGQEARCLQGQACQVQLEGASDALVTLIVGVTILESLIQLRKYTHRTHFVVVHDAQIPEDSVKPCFRCFIQVSAFWPATASLFYQSAARAHSLLVFLGSMPRHPMESTLSFRMPVAARTFPQVCQVSTPCVGAGLTATQTVRLPATSKFSQAWFE